MADRAPSIDALPPPPNSQAVRRRDGSDRPPIPTQPYRRRAWHLESFAIIDVSADDDKHAAEGYYPYLLELCEKYFESELDQSTYEENLRMMWGIKAFPLFTVDKMVSALIKHVSA